MGASVRSGGVSVQVMIGVDGWRDQYFWSGVIELKREGCHWKDATRGKAGWHPSVFELKTGVDFCVYGNAKRGFGTVIGWWQWMEASV